MGIQILSIFDACDVFIYLVQLQLQRKKLFLAIFGSKQRFDMDLPFCINSNYDLKR